MEEMSKRFHLNICNVVGSDSMNFITLIAILQLIFAGYIKFSLSIYRADAICITNNNKKKTFSNISYMNKQWYAHFMC